MGRQLTIIFGFVPTPGSRADITADTTQSINATPNNKQHPIYENVKCEETVRSDVLLENRYVCGCFVMARASLQIQPNSMQLAYNSTLPVLQILVRRDAQEILPRQTNFAVVDASLSSGAYVLYLTAQLLNWLRNQLIEKQLVTAFPCSCARSRRPRARGGWDGCVEVVVQS